jgi:arylsulfatase A-like enzyme
MNTYKLLLNVLLCLSVFGCSTEKKQDKPNVLIIFIDDMGFADPSCFGNTVVETPNIDRIAENGLKFTNFYVNSPICSPSRVAINTGQYPMRHKIHSYIDSAEKNKNRAMDNFLNPNVETLARTLNNNGYATGHFGKWHMGGGRDLGDVPLPTEYGYDKSVVSFEGVGTRVLFPDDKLSAMSAKLGNGDIIWAPKHKSTSIYVDSALAFIQKYTDKPFFVNLCPNDVHDPHLPDSLVLEKYKTVTNNPYEQRFFAVLDELDKQIGRIYQTLEKMGKLDNTILVFTSDNGPTDWHYYYKRHRYPEGYSGACFPPGATGNFHGRKWSLYEGGIRVPFLIQWKGKIPAGKTDSTTMMAAFDLFPSICNLLGIETPKGLDGMDKSKALLGKPLQQTEPVFWEYASNPGGSIQPGNPGFKSPNLAVRMGNWKLLMNGDHSEKELYNLTTDPSETNNLVATNKEKADELAVKLMEWRKSMPVEIVVNR